MMSWGSMDKMDYWFWIRIVMGIVFVAALFFTILRGLNMDLIALVKKRKKKDPVIESFNDAYNKGFQAGLEHGEERKSASRICEGFNCVNVADETGAMVEHGDERKIVCATCLPIWVRTGWTVVFSWGLEND